MKYGLIIVFHLVCVISLSAQLKIVDLDSGDPVTFATIISCDSLFQTNSNAKGEFQIPPNVDSIYISCIGYETKKEIGVVNKTTIFLKYKSYSISGVSIISKKIDVYDEINKLRKRLTKSKKKLSRQSNTTFETVSNQKLIERGEIHSNDLITSKNGYILDNRLKTTYNFDTTSVFIHVDIDKLVRQIRITSKNGFMHLLNRGKIKPSNTELNIVEETESNFLVKYSFEEQNGFLRFNKETYEISEYNIKSHGIDNNLYESINNSIGIRIDTFILDYKFKDEIIDDVSFFLSYTVESLGLVTTSGYIKDYNSEVSWLSTKKHPHSLQFHARLTSFVERDHVFNDNSIFFDIEDHTIKLVKDDELAFKILVDLGHAPDTEFWSASKRLNSSNLIQYDQITRSKASRRFRSDYHDYEIDWMFYKNPSNVDIYIPLPSIWNSSKAIFISKSTYNTLLLANLTYDIYEIQKNEFVEAINNNQNNGHEVELMNEYFKKAKQMVDDMNKDSNYGNSVLKLISYNEYVFSETGVDNLKILLANKHNIETNSKYSKGDVLLASGDANGAIEFYEILLYDDGVKLDIKKLICENLIQTYLKLGDKNAACEIHNEWIQNATGNKLDLGHYVLNCD